MANWKNNKQYGLILSGKGPGTSSTTPRKNVFGDDSDSDSDDGGDWVKKSLKREAQKSVLKRTTKVQMKKALEEDPTVFQYDEVYDDLEQKKEEAKTSKKEVEKKPRYIQALLQTAERRKKENERRIERQVQKEREAEGEQFADKESFVTASYRQKLEEFKKQEEEEKRMERLEAIGDVTRQKDLTGFYRHLYRQTMGETLPGATDSSETNNGESGSPGEGTVAPEGSQPKSSVIKREVNKERHYRKRQSSSSSGHSDTETTKVTVKTEDNVDDDSEFTGSSSSSSESGSSATGSGSEEGEITKKKKTQKRKRKENETMNSSEKQQKSNEGVTQETSSSSASLEKKTKLISSISPTEKKIPTEETASITAEKKDIDVEVKKEANVSVKEEEVKQPKINIWAKRTIGEVFDNAVQRYYERKAVRASMKTCRA